MPTSGKIEEDETMKCRAITKSGKRCSRDAEEGRNGLCAAHDFSEGRCRALTSKGKPCSLPGEERRDGYCHLHDPFGEHRMVKIRERNRREKLKKKRGKTRA